MPHTKSVITYLKSTLFVVRPINQHQVVWFHYIWVLLNSNSRQCLSTLVAQICWNITPPGAIDSRNNVHNKSQNMITFYAMIYAACVNRSACRMFFSSVPRAPKMVQYWCRHRVIMVIAQATASWRNNDNSDGVWGLNLVNVTFVRCICNLHVFNNFCFNVFLW